MPVVSRYTPIAPGDADETLSLDFSPILVPAEALTGGTLRVETNTNPPSPSLALAVNAVWVSGTALVASVTAAESGTGDQILTFTAATTLRPSLSRTALIWVGATS